MNSARLLSFFLFVVAAAAGAIWLLQQQTGNALRLEADLLRAEKRELAQLEAENRRLKTALPPATELAALRADRAAVERLRLEIEKLKDNVQRRERALAASGN